MTWGVDPIGAAPWGADEEAAPSGPTYTLSAASGTFSYSGGDVGLAFNRVLAAASGTLSYTGGDATFSRGRTLSAAGGTFAYSGGDASFLRTYVLIVLSLPTVIEITATTARGRVTATEYA